MSLAASVAIVGTVDISLTTQLRFQRQVDGSWKPELIVSLTDGTVERPPPCFRPSQDVIDALDAAVARTFA